MVAMAPGCSDQEVPQDAMVIVAALVSRVEALVVASMLEAAGIQVCVGAVGHASVEVNSLALGGHRLWVPASQHIFATQILREVLGKEEWRFSNGLRRAILRLLAILSGFTGFILFLGAWTGAFGLPEVFLWPLSALSVPVNPQGRGDYYLCDNDGRTYRA